MENYSTSSSERATVFRPDVLLTFFGLVARLKEVSSVGNRQVIVDGAWNDEKQGIEMKKLLAVSALAACATGCVMPSAPINAPIAIDVQGPMSYVDNSVKPQKIGVATAKGILLYVDGDASVAAAMKNGGISKVHHIDTKSRNILGIVGEFTTLVYGE